jgi:hypothetical protein
VDLAAGRGDEAAAKDALTRLEKSAAAATPAAGTPPRPSSAASSPRPAPARAPAAPLSDRPATTPSSAAAPAALAPAPAASGPPSPGTLIAARELDEAKIRADAAGQWAASATAGTQYGRGVPYSPTQATGAPNVPMAGNSPNAWCPAVADRGTDWFEAVFAKPVRATEVRVRQNDGVGAIVKVEAIEPDGTTHVWWEGVDPYQRGRVREVVWFAVRVPPTPYPVARVKLTLNLAAGPFYKQIDAVQLVGATP